MIKFTEDYNGKHYIENNKGLKLELFNLKKLNMEQIAYLIKSISNMLVSLAYHMNKRRKTNESKTD